MVIQETKRDKVFNFINYVLLTVIFLACLYPLWFIILASVSNPDLVNSGKVWFTSSKDQKNLYALYALPENEHLPTVIEWEGNKPAKGSTMRLLQNNKKLKWQTKGNKTTVYLPKNIKQESLVLTFKLH